MFTPGPGDFDPLTLVPDMWYDPSDLSTLWTDAGKTTNATVGDPVYWMDDKSGNGRHLSQATLSSRPILRQDAGGEYYLEFDGSNDSLNTSSPNIGTITDGHATVAGVRRTNLTGGFFWFGVFSTQHWAYIENNSGTADFDIGGQTAPLRLSTTNPVAVGSPTVVTCRSSNASAFQEIYYNGTLTASDASGSSYTPGNQFWLGAGAGFIPCPLDCYGFFFKKGILSASEQDDLEAYYANRLAAR